MLHNVSASSKNTTFQMPNFLLTNVRSLRYKIDELECVINNNFVNICCVTESWLNESISTESINIAGFVCHKHDRESGHKGGGVVCYVDEDWPCTRLQSSKPMILKRCGYLCVSRGCQDTYLIL